jgi:hypothetical protein
LRIYSQSGMSRFAVAVGMAFSILGRHNQPCWITGIEQGSAPPRRFFLYAVAVFRKSLR